MTVLSTDERRELACSVRAACEKFASQERVRAAAYDGDGGRGGVDAELWTVLCAQIGVAQVALPEHLGGAGYGASALGVVAHELGRVLAPVPFVASAVLATGLLLDTHAGDHDTRLSRPAVRATHRGGRDHRRRRTVVSGRRDARTRHAAATIGASTASSAMSSTARSPTTC